MSEIRKCSANTSARDDGIKTGLETNARDDGMNASVNTCSTCIIHKYEYVQYAAIRHALYFDRAKNHIAESPRTGRRPKGFFPREVTKQKSIGLHNHNNNNKDQNGQEPMRCDR